MSENDDKDIFLEEMERIKRQKREQAVENDDLRNKLKITFVCSGNICRSAYAEFAFKEMVEKSEILKDKIIIDSGALVFQNDSIDSRTTRVLLEDGSKFTRREIEAHKPRYKGNYPDMFDDTDIIVGMTGSHKRNTPKRWRKGPEAKFRMLSELAVNEKIDVGDPYWSEDYEEYKKILMDVKRYLKNILEKLENYFKED